MLTIFYVYWLAKIMVLSLEKELIDFFDFESFKILGRHLMTIYKMG